MEKNLCFVVVRCVTNASVNRYWNECYRCIRKFYPDTPILIVDDTPLNCEQFIVTESSTILENYTIQKSEYPQCGELLGYYYFHKLKFAENAIVIHDSVFVDIKLELPEDLRVKFLWSFEHNWDNYNREKNIAMHLNHSEEIMNLFNNQSEWKGMFGVMSAINYNFLDNLNIKYNLFALVNVMKSRENRKGMERIFALLCTLEEPDCNIISSFGDIHKYKWGYNFENYLNRKKNINCFVKCWTGR